MAIKVSQNDYLPKQEAKYPLFIVEAETDELTAVILNALPKEGTIPVCLRRFDDILEVGKVPLDIRVIYFLTGSCTLSVKFSENDEHICDSVESFMKVYTQRRK